jgi:hypothetical protein
VLFLPVNTLRRNILELKTAKCSEFIWFEKEEEGRHGTIVVFGPNFDV